MSRRYVVFSALTELWTLWILWYFLCVIMWPVPTRPHYALHPLRPSVRLYVCPLPTVNSKTENHATSRLRGEVTHVRSNWQSKFEVKWSKIKVNGGEKRGPYIACLAYITYSLKLLPCRCGVCRDTVYFDFVYVIRCVSPLQHYDQMVTVIGMNFF